MPRSLDEWLRGFVVDSARSDVTDHFIDVVVTGISDSVPLVSDDAVLREEVISSIRGHWLYFLDTLSTDRQQFSMPRQATTLVRTIAHRGMEVTVLLKIYRAAYKGVFSYLTEVSNALERDDPSPHDVLAFLWTRGERWLDESIDQLIEVFYAERAAITDVARRRQRAIIDAVIAGETIDATVASNTLRYPLTQWHTAAIAWMDDPDVSDTSTLIAVASSLASDLGTSSVLTAPVGARDVWFWLATATPPDVDVVRSVIKPLQDNGIHLVTGIPAPGLAGFRGGHLQAQAVQQLVLPAADIPAVVVYSDVELLCLTDGSRDLRRAMIAREIGPLCTDDKSMTPIRETLLAYLATRNVEETASTLFVHKNTVRYRLGKAEELLGHPLSERATEVDLALRYVALFGVEALR
ncbi:hypothetical protein HH308_10280 [Gordonia sp. TBRC 11910]|uniref:PucR family transcriptional regulator n=1 Tax=Gordonia asplenii TaxID=2725283 RepID=A0A848KTU0_9ACTN|nr:helix-turn-helix domain-containing protein [Gordonia asplenii]NMO01599.1 hypothetical protein [Gordonia asplenii]